MELEVLTELSPMELASRITLIVREAIDELRQSLDTENIQKALPIFVSYTQESDTIILAKLASVIDLGNTMGNQLYVIVDVPISFEDKEYDELAYDIERYGGIINDEKWHAGPDPAFDWISTRVIIPAKWIDNLPQGGYERNGFILSPLFRLPNGRLVISTTTLDVNQDRSVIYEYDSG